MILKIFIFSLTLFIPIVYGNLCISRATCRECISANGQCAWCLQEIPENVTQQQEFKKCNLLKELKQYCDETKIYYPINELKIKQNNSFKPLDGKSPAIQITPQKVNLKLRPHIPIRFNISYQLAEDYPVDLYFLMDLSNSMYIHKDKLSKLGQKLASNMRSITKNFRLGFGSFVEKETMPFVNTAPRKFNNPCITDDLASECVAPYSFIHHMALSDDTIKFEEEVTAAKVSGNLDSPEGGFDALMQVVVCDAQIGWRPASRKLIVYSTDAGFHFAGDGKLAGIVEPNDGLCHLAHYKGESYKYTHSLEQDYPSIGEINYKISQNNINLIFAVIPEQVNLYKNLSEIIEGSFVGQLNNDSSNIVQLVVDIYKTIAKKIVFATETLPEGLQVKFYSKCLGDRLIETNSCNELKIKQKVDFEVELMLTKCPSATQLGKRSLTIHAQGIDEQINISYEALCDCECEKDKPILNSILCNMRGKIVCGACECDDFSYGLRCECSKLDTIKANTSSCIDPKAAGITKFECNNQGTCNCGQCVCYEPNRVTGKYCECDNESCERHLGLVCGGNGQCDCGVCKCNQGWEGSSCSCTSDTTSCISSNGLICNGKGNCTCGKCVCDKESGYFGALCEECTNCVLPCERNRDCVLCKVGRRPLTNNFDCDQCDLQVEIVDTLPMNNSDMDDSHKKCQFVDSNDNKCTFYFSYDKKNDKQIQYQTRRDCPKSLPLWIIPTIIASSVVVVGILAIVVYKVIMLLKYKQEFARFNEEKKKANWGTSENPLFKPATTRFENPAYSKIHAH